MIAIVFCFMKFVCLHRFDSRFILVLPSQMSNSLHTYMSLCFVCITDPHRIFHQFFILGIFGIGRLNISVFCFCFLGSSWVPRVVRWYSIHPLKVPGLDVPLMRFTLAVPSPQLVICTLFFKGDNRDQRPYCSQNRKASQIRTNTHNGCHIHHLFILNEHDGLCRPEALRWVMQRHCFVTFSNFSNQLLSLIEDWWL